MCVCVCGGGVICRIQTHTFMCVLVLQFVKDGRDCAPRNHVVALVDTIQRTVDLDERVP